MFVVICRSQISVLDGSARRDLLMTVFNVNDGEGSMTTHTDRYGSSPVRAHAALDPGCPGTDRLREVFNHNLPSVRCARPEGVSSAPTSHPQLHALTARRNLLSRGVSPATQPSKEAMCLDGYASGDADRDSHRYQFVPRIFRCRIVRSLGAAGNPSPSSDYA